MRQRRWTCALAALAAAGVLTGCKLRLGGDSGSGSSKPTQTVEQPAEVERPDEVVGPFDKPGFKAHEEDGRLWVLKPGQEKSAKHITLIGAGPRGMTLKAPDKQTALEYIAAKPGFHVEVTEDGRLWVLKPGQEKSAKHITLISAGPRGMTVKARDKRTALEYIAAKPGFHVEVTEDGRLWVFTPGQKKTAKHVTRIGAGPRNMTVKAPNRTTLDAYLGVTARP